MKRLTTKALKAVRSDSDLFKKVGDALGISPSSVGNALTRNGNSLNQFHIVEMIAAHMGIPAAEAVEEVEEESATA